MLLENQRGCFYNREAEETFSTKTRIPDTNREKIDTLKYTFKCLYGKKYLRECHQRYNRS